MKQGIFISYRRDTGSTMARMIYDRLRLEKQYQCFLDVEKLNAGNFRENISLEMDKCDIFLLILSRNALNRCSNPNDNVRREILEAMDRNLAIIPVTAEDFVWPEQMPEGIESIQDYNAIPYVQVYSDQFFERLYSFIETVRAEERAREDATREQEGTAVAARRSAKTGEKQRDFGQHSAPAVSDPGKSSGGAAKKPGNKSILLMIIGAVAVAAIIAGIVLFSGPGKQMDGQEADGTAEPQQTQEAAVSEKTELSVTETPVAETEDSSEASVPEVTETSAKTETAAPDTTQQETESVVQTGSAGAEYASFTAGTSQAEAGEIPLSVKVKGSYAEGSIFGKFTTNSDANTKYYMVLQNLTADCGELKGYLLNKYGEVVQPTRRNNNYGDGRIFNAKNSGTPSYAMFDNLKTDTTYFIRIEGSRKADYSLAVTLPEEEKLICIQKASLSDPDAYYAATNPDSAPLLTVNQKYKGSYDSGYAWIAFRTGGKADEKYYVTLQNYLADSHSFVGYLFDEYGQQVYAARRNNNYGDGRILCAESDGRTSFSLLDTLKADTVYYIRIENEGKAAYSVSVSTEGNEGMISTPKETLSAADNYHTAANPDEAPLMALNEEYQGHYDSGYTWVAFTTGNSNGQAYYITLTNTSSDSETLSGYLFDEYGQQVYATRRNNNNGDGRILSAKNDGSTSFSMVDTLKPETAYYIRIHGGSKADYRIGVSDRE